MKSKTPLFLALSLCIISSPLHALHSQKTIILKHPEPWQLERCLLRLVQRGENTAVKSFINKHKNININCTDLLGHTPLHHACTKSYTSIIKFLLKQKRININKSGPWGETPLHIAARRGIASIVRLFLTHCAINVNKTDKEGKTPLCYTACNADPYTLQLLLESKKIDLEDCKKVLKLLENNKWEFDTQDDKRIITSRIYINRQSLAKAKDDFYGIREVNKQKVKKMLEEYIITHEICCLCLEVKEKKEIFSLCMCNQELNTCKECKVLWNSKNKLCPECKQPLN